LDTIPLFVKGGGIIPMQPEMRYSGEKPAGLITLDIFPYGHSAYDWYEDDGLSQGYQKGDFSITKIGADLAAGKLTLAIAKPDGKFQPPAHTYLAKIHWNDKEPVLVTENGVKLQHQNASGRAGWYYDPADHILWIATKGNNKGDIELKIN
jgi:alpha-glucosidase